jgi:hypothetical protein
MVKYKYTTKVTFKALTDDRRLVHKTIPIHHNFEVIPEQEFMGVMLPPTSVEYQVIHFLDEQDKSELMVKYGFYMIIDYYVKKKRKTKADEFEEFRKFLAPYFAEFPTLKRPFEAIISESKDTLFGKGKSNETKLKEVMNAYEMIIKGIHGAINMILNKDNKTLESYEQDNDDKTLCCNI